MAARKQKIEPWNLRENRKRKKNVIPLRKRYLICTEGKEAIYFAHYKSSTGPIIISLDKSNHKVNLVRKAIEEKGYWFNFVHFIFKFREFSWI